MSISRGSLAVAEPRAGLKLPRVPDLAGDLWGGLAAMLVALPSAIAFGVTIFAPLGGSYAAYGALAGILGATALGLVAPLLGGTNRLITAPCAPAAAVLAAFAIGQMHDGRPADSVLLLVTLIALITGVLQMGMGAVGLGRLIKYMPFPVVSGYLSGVGLTIIGSQVPRLLGAGKGAGFWSALAHPAQWQWEPIVVGVVTIAVMSIAPRFTKAIPAAILGLLGGVVVYFAISAGNPALRSLSGNALVIGPVGASGAGFVGAFVDRFTVARGLGSTELMIAIMPALTLAVLLSIDTLKTCVVLDAVTHSRHESNRELVGQGAGNLLSALVGGIPGAGTMGATLVNISSGARTRASGVIEGALALVAFLALGSVIAWVPVAALAGILIVVGVRMFDRASLQFLRSRSTMLDFAVIAAVIATALTVSLIAASGVGVVLAIGLFLREQIGGSIVRRKTYAHQMRSKRMRLPGALEILRDRGTCGVIYELQGSLFFGTADKLYSALEPELSTRRYVVLDMRRVQSVDVTAAHVLEQIKDVLAEHGGMLLLSNVPRALPTGQDVQRYFGEVGLVTPQGPVRTFPELDDAVEWIEDRILDEARIAADVERPLELAEIDLFAQRKANTLADLDAALERRSAPAGTVIFSSGDRGDDLFLIRRGTVRVMLPLDGGEAHHLSTFGRGDFFGEMAFLDGQPRSANAVAETDVDLFVLSRSAFERFEAEHHRAATSLMHGLARVLAIRLRVANSELQALEEA